MQDVTKGVTQLSSVLDMGYSSENVLIYIKINNRKPPIQLYF